MVEKLKDDGLHKLIFGQANNAVVIAKLNNPGGSDYEEAIKTLTEIVANNSDAISMLQREEKNS